MIKRLICWMRGHRWTSRIEDLGPMSPGILGAVGPHLYVAGDATRLTKTHTWCERCMEPPIIPSDYYGIPDVLRGWETNWPPLEGARLKMGFDTYYYSPTKPESEEG